MCYAVIDANSDEDLWITFPYVHVHTQIWSSSLFCCPQVGDFMSAWLRPSWWTSQHSVQSHSSLFRMESVRLVSPCSSLVSVALFVPVFHGCSHHVVVSEDAPGRFLLFDGSLCAHKHTSYTQKQLPWQAALRSLHEARSVSAHSSAVDLTDASWEDNSDTVWALSEITGQVMSSPCHTFCNQNTSWFSFQWFLVWTWGFQIKYLSKEASQTRDGDTTHAELQPFVDRLNTISIIKQSLK